MSRLRYAAPVPRPNPSYGSYALGLTSGIIPATPLAAKDVFQFRWNPANRSLLAVIKKIEVFASVSTTMFAAGVPVELALYKAVAWSVAGTQGTAVTIDATAKRDAAMAASGLVAGDCRIANTDADGILGGTRTALGNRIASKIAGGPITAGLNGTVFGDGNPLYKADVGAGDYPIVLTPGAAAANAEGLAIQATAPATGTWRLSVNIEWEETLAYPY